MFMFPKNVYAEFMGGQLHWPKVVTRPKGKMVSPGFIYHVQIVVVFFGRVVGPAVVAIFVPVTVVLIFFETRRVVKKLGRSPIQDQWNVKGGSYLSLRFNLVIEPLKPPKEALFQSKQRSFGKVLMVPGHWSLFLWGISQTKLPSLKDNSHRSVPWGHRRTVPSSFMRVMKVCVWCSPFFWDRFECIGLIC